MSNYPRWPESLDIDAPLGKTYTAKIPLPVGDSLTLVAIDVVDATSTTVNPSPATAITAVTPGAVNGIPAVSFHALGGVAGDLYLRITYETALGNGDHATRRIVCEQR